MDQLGNAIATPLLITGSQGYLGKRIGINLSQRGIGATGISRSDVDLTSANSVRQNIPTGATIIHCAAVVPKTTAEYTDEAAAAENLRMVELLIDRAPHHLVLISSMTVYTRFDRPVREEDAANNLPGYAGGKRKAEQLIEKSEIAATMLRLPGLFGPPRHSGFLYKAAQQFAGGEAMTIPDDPPLWAALHVDDAAEMVVRAASLQPAPKCQTINIGYDHVFSLSRALSDIARAFDLNPPHPTGTGPEFSMELSRMRAVLGDIPATWGSRVRELAAIAREERC